MINRVGNWPYYLLRKIFGFHNTFTFHIKKFRKISVPPKMLGPFKENFFDKIYFRHIPKQVFKKKSSPIIIDIGANVGFFSMSAFAQFPKAKIYAFEPHPFCFQVLSSYKKDNQDLKWNIYNKAVSDKNEPITLNTSSIEAFATMTSTFKHKTIHDKVFTVDAIRLDSFIKEEQITEIDFIKLDCEGAEYSILYSLPAETFDHIKSLGIETHRGMEEDQNIYSLNKYFQNLGYSTKMVIETDYAGYIWAWR